jgi:lipopolysaccharide/colanic/teichoic acid biosynthesis glycosyltransferase
MLNQRLVKTVQEHSEKTAFVYEKIDYFVEQQQDKHLPHYMLKWRQGQLLVSLEEHVKQPYISAFESEQRLVECLKHSPVRLVCIDPSLGEVGLKRWADACEQANKSVFLGGVVARKLFRKQSQLSWRLKQLINWVAALLLLMVLSPVMLAIVVLMRVHSQEPIFCRQWYVGARGKLFRILKFRTMVVNDDCRTTPLGRWMCKYSLDKLLQLFNVLRGEMNLVGRRPWTLSEAVQLISESQQRLNALPGIVEIQSIEVRAKELNFAG